MADISLIQDDSLDDSDEGVFEQGDGPSGGAIDDDSLTPLLRTQKYAESGNVFDRQMVWRVVLELFKTGPPDLVSKDLPHIMNVLIKMAEEDEILVRTDLLDQIPNLVATAFDCANRIPELNNILSDYLLPLVVRTLGNGDNQLRKTAHSTLFVLMDKNLITKQQVEIQVCPTVLALSSMDNMMDYHSGVVTLMSRLAPFLGREVTERVFLQRFSQLCSNHMFYVRKVCASHFGDFCAVIGKDAYEHVLLPCYIALCSDDIWGVRKACAEVVISVSCACPPNKRRFALAPVFAKLLRDQSRWVRMSAFQTLGPFISTFADPTITSLAYNNMGELVLVNNDGTEFRLSPTYTDSNILRSVGELQMLYQFQERSKYIEEVNVFDGKEDDDIIFNPLNDMESGSDADCKEIKIDNVALEIEVSSENSNAEIISNEEDYWKENLDTNSEIIVSVDDILRNAADKVLQDMFHETDENTSSASNVIDDTQSKCDNLDKSSSQDVNELSRKVSFMDVSNNDHCYVLNQNLNEIVDNSNNLNGDCLQTQIKNEPESLDQYNSYNYWYVSPDLPLDPSIVNEEAIPINNDRPVEPIKDSFTWMRHFDSLYDYLNSPKPPLPSPVQSMSEKEVEEVKVVNELEPSQHIVPQLLIDHFVSMTDINVAHETDNEMAYHCAYSLPAVALTLGSKNWHLLKDTVEVLAANMQYKVRRTVASSLHELAMILGPEIATNNLTPIFEGFLKDLDEVRIGVLKHLAHFLRLISPAKRNIYLPRLAEFLQTDNEANWRFRQELAEQLLLSIPLFRPSDATKHISTLAQELLCDKVAAVREVALLLVTELIRHIAPDQTLTSRLLVKLAERFAHSKRWKRRQSFALLCAEMLASKSLLPEQFSCEVMAHLLDLSWDPVANVRLVVARTISQHIVTNEYFADVSSQHYDGLQTVLRRLQSDKDRDVRQSAVFHKFTSIQ